MTAIRKFNKYCDALAELSDPATNIPLPQHLKTELSLLRDDPYLMEDVWVHPSTTAAPPWLTDIKVRKGIRAMLKDDRCVEEYCHLGREADNLCRWFGQELAAIELAIQTNTGGLAPSRSFYHILTYFCQEPLLSLLLLKERTSILRLQTLWQTPITPKHVLLSLVERSTNIALQVSGKPPKPIALHWLPSQVSPHPDNHEKYLDNDCDTDEWDDVPHFDSSQEMLADIVVDDGSTEVSVNSIWVPLVC